MDPLIENLKSTTFLGKRFTRKQLADIQITVGRFPKLSRAELGRTICEHLCWRTPGGRDRLKSALGLLEELERLGILSLPPKRHRGRGRQKPVELTSRTAPRSLIDGPLAGLAPLQLEPVTKPEAVAEWNEWVQRYHPLGYRQPLGTHLRYFLLDGEKRQLGCLLFDFAARNVRCRDEWIGWPVGQHHRHLNLVVRNARFVLFPWVQVKCLASQALGLALRQLPQDWQRRHGCRPVLAETYVDPRQHQGTCYRAANWQCVGQTQARGAMGGVPAKTPKDVYVYPLHADWRRILQQGPPKAAKPRRSPPRAGPRFVQLWQELIGTLVRVAGAHDREWIKRRRTLNTLLVMLFVFRLVFAPDRRGYATVLAELWDHCRQLEVTLPQPQPVSAAAICQARAKVDEEIFRSAHRAVLERLPGDGPGALWHGHRAFAVDGSKLNLPRPLVRAGYRTPGDKAHYPQGLLSCLYQLRARLPVDFDLHAHGDERRAALAHLAALAPGDVIVYDRGYYSFQLLHAHCERRLHAVFRLQRNANALFREFMLGDRSDALVTVLPSDRARQQCPQAALRPCRVRLVKYAIGDRSYTLATTLLDRKRYRGPELTALYHGRWSIEELYKISKQMLTVEHFHGRSERLVKQELYAHFTLIALTRLFASQCEKGFRDAPDGHGRPAWQANFQNSLRTVARHLEGLFLQHATALQASVQRILEGVARCRQRRRPGRSYPRRSRKPASKWRNPKATDPADPADPA